MYKLFRLSYVQFKNSFHFFDGKQKVKPIHIFGAVLIALSLLPSLFSLGFLVREGLFILMPLQQEAVVLSLWVVGMSSFIFFIALFMIPALFYFNKDIERLLVLPIQARTLLLSKLILVYVYEGLTVLFISLPVLIPYVALVQPDFWFYPIALLLLLTISIVPLTLSGLLVMVVMGLFPRFKNRDLFNLLSSFIILGFAIAFSLAINQPLDMDVELLAQALVEGNNSLTQFIQGFIFSASFAIKAIVEYSWLDVLIYVFVSLLSLIVFVVLGQVLYFKGVIGVSETASRRSQLSETTYQKATQKTPVIFAYWLKEMRLLIRTPIYLFNNVSTSLLMPIIMIPVLFTQASSDDQFVLWLQSIDWSDPSVYMMVMLVGLILGFALSALNIITPSAISREGTSIGFMKYIPLSYNHQIYAKLLSGLAISFMGLMIFVLALAFILKWSIALILLALLSASLASLLINQVGLIIDLLRPKLIWENEAVPVKQNLNGIFSMGIAFVLSAGFFFLNQWLDASLFSASLMLILIVALNVLTWFVLNYSVNPLMNQIEM